MWEGFIYKEVSSMEKEKILFTSESVSEGHPDKVCDQIADAILDACLKEDKNARVACEVFASNNFVLVGGEITCKVQPNYVQIVKDVLKDIGYDRPELGTDYHTVEVVVKTDNTLVVTTQLRISLGIRYQLTNALSTILSIGNRLQIQPLRSHSHQRKEQCHTCQRNEHQGY